MADQAYGNRQLDIVGGVAELLLSLPLSRQLESVAYYYQALSLNRSARGSDKAVCLLEQAAENAPLHYRARAMVALGTKSLRVCQQQTALSFYREAMRVATHHNAFEPVSFCVASRMTAVISGINGDNRAALTHLEGLYPLARIAGSLQPYVYYDYLNNVAVELGVVGRLEQARRASEIALASPFASAYPEWHETLDDIVAKQQQASRSIVPVRQGISAVQNLVHLAARETDANPELAAPYPQGIQARVLSLQQWKSMAGRMGSPLIAKLTPEQRKRLTTGEKLIRLMDLLSQEDTDDETIERILEAAEQIVANRRKPRLD